MTIVFVRNIFSLQQFFWWHFIFGDSLFATRVPPFLWQLTQNISRICCQIFTSEGRWQVAAQCGGSCSVATSWLDFLFSWQHHGRRGKVASWPTEAGANCWRRRLQIMAMIDKDFLPQLCSEFLWSFDAVASLAAHSLVSLSVGQWHMLCSSRLCCQWVNAVPTEAWGSFGQFLLPL